MKKNMSSKSTTSSEDFNEIKFVDQPDWRDFVEVVTERNIEINYRGVLHLEYESGTGYIRVYEHRNGGKVDWIEEYDGGDLGQLIEALQYLHKEMQKVGATTIREDKYES